MAIYDDRWFEIWYSEGEDIIPYYLLVVSFDRTLGEVVARDPKEGNKIVFKAKTYEEVRDWLGADEFDLVEGRMFPDDGY